MGKVKSKSSTTFYPFQYFIKWQMSKKRTKFGKILREKWNAICDTVAKEREIFLDEFHMTSAFDCVYFYLWSVPKYSPHVVLNSVKIGVYNIITGKYPDLREELINDTWYLVNRRDFSIMEYIAYFARWDVKADVKRGRSKIFEKSVNGIQISELVKSEISEAVDYYNRDHEKPIDILSIKFYPKSVELVVGCPITISASEIIWKIRINTSRQLRKKYPQFSDRNSSLFVHERYFWSRGRFLALSPRSVEALTRDKSSYLRLQRKWKEVKNEKGPHKKGKLLELFTADMIEITTNFEILKKTNGKYDVNLGFEQIDLTLKNKSKLIDKWGNLIKVECKNWDRPVGNFGLRDVASKLRGDIRLGILISVKGFGKYDKELLKRLFWKDNKLIVTISGNEIEGWLDKIIEGFKEGVNKRYSIENLLENKILLSELELT